MRLVHEMKLSILKVIKWLKKLSGDSTNSIFTKLVMFYNVEVVFILINWECLIGKCLAEGFAAGLFVMTTFPLFSCVAGSYSVSKHCITWLVLFPFHPVIFLISSWKATCLGMQLFLLLFLLSWWFKCVVFFFVWVGRLFDDICLSLLINDQMLQFFSTSLMMVIISCLFPSQCLPTMAQKIVMAADLVVLMHLEWVLVFQSALVVESILNTWMETTHEGMLLLYQVLKLYEVHLLWSDHKEQQCTVHVNETFWKVTCWILKIIKWLPEVKF